MSLNLEGSLGFCLFTQLPGNVGPAGSHTILWIAKHTPYFTLTSCLLESTDRHLLTKSFFFFFFKYKSNPNIIHFKVHHMSLLSLHTCNFNSSVKSVSSHLLVSSYAWRPLWVIFLSTSLNNWFFLILQVSA